MTILDTMPQAASRQEWFTAGSLAKAYFAYGALWVFVPAAFRRLPEDQRKRIGIAFFGSALGLAASFAFVTDITRLLVFLATFVAIAAGCFLQEVHSVSRVWFHILVGMLSLNLFLGIPTVLTASTMTSMRELEEFYQTFRYYIGAYHLTALGIVFLVMFKTGVHKTKTWAGRKSSLK